MIQNQCDELQAKLDKKEATLFKLVQKSER